jgi:hypothetical protein
MARRGTLSGSIMTKETDASGKVNKADLLVLEQKEAVQRWKCGKGFQDEKSYNMFKMSFSSIPMYQCVLNMLR